MSFFRDLFRRKKTDEKSVITDDQHLISQEISDLENLQIATCFSSFDDTGMKIQAQGDICRDKFPSSLLHFTANLNAVLCEQSKGEHLFGPMPLPHVTYVLDDTQTKSDLVVDDWYLLVFVFTSRDLKIRDTRVKRSDFITAGVFLIFYPRSYDYVLMGLKQELKQILSSVSGVIRGINDFTDEKLSDLEKQLGNVVISQYQQKTQDSHFKDFEQIRMSLEYQFTAINERFRTLVTLSKNYFLNAKVKGKSANLASQSIAFVFIHRISDIVTGLQYHFPPTRGLDGFSWHFYQPEPGVVELTTNGLHLWFLSPSRINTFLKTKEVSQIPFNGIFIGTEIPEKSQINDLIQYLNQVSKSKNDYSLVIHNEIGKTIIDAIANNIKEKDTKVHYYHQKGEDDTIFSQIAWFYDIFINQFQQFIKEKTIISADSDQYFSQKERTSIHSLYSQPLDSDND